jgi:hypothetical protein
MSPLRRRTDRLPAAPRVAVALLCAALGVTGCSRETGVPAADPGDLAGGTAPISEAALPGATPPPPAVATEPPRAAPRTPRPVVDIPIRLVRAVDDPATAGFAEFAAAVLTDRRGWRRAGFVVRITDDAPFTVVLAEGAEVDRLCLPYDTGGQYSCQNGPIVALNADRWRTATDTWPATLAEYRTMLLNHEVGHLLGQHHPEQRCTRPGRRAAVMAQQSSRLDGCAPNPWPLRWEIVCAAKHLEPLAPGYEESPTPLCGPGDVPS